MYRRNILACTLGVLEVDHAPLVNLLWVPKVSNLALECAWISSIRYGEGVKQVSSFLYTSLLILNRVLIDSSYRMKTRTYSTASSLTDVPQLCLILSAQKREKYTRRFWNLVLTQPTFSLKDSCTVPGFGALSGIIVCGIVIPPTSLMIAWQKSN